MLHNRKFISKEICAKMLINKELANEEHIKSLRATNQKNTNEITDLLKLNKRILMKASKDCLAIDKIAELRAENEKNTKEIEDLRSANEDIEHKIEIMV